MGLRRLRVRAERRLKQRIGDLRRVPEIAVLAFGLAVVGAVLVATRAGAPWATILRAQAVNVLSGLVLGGFAYVLFVLRYRNAQLDDYLGRCAVVRPEARPRPGLYAMSPKARAPFVDTMVDELLASRPRRSCLVIGPGEAGRELLADVAERLAKRKIVPVSVELSPDTDPAAVAGMVRDQFVARLVGAAGDARSGQRLYAFLWKRRRVVALVSGLNQIGRGKPVGARCELLTAVLQELSNDDIAFAAYVQPALAPTISEVATFRVRPLGRAELHGYAVRRLEEHGVSPELLGDELAAVFAEVEPTRDPMLLDLGLDLLALRIAGNEGDAPAKAVRDLFGHACVAYRHLGWMCEWLLRCSPAAAGADQSPAAFALDAIGMEGHYREALEVSLDLVSSGLDVEGRRRLVLGVAMLRERGVLTVSDMGKETLVRFTHPAWFAFAGALALRLEPQRWGDLLRPGAPPATLEALTATLLMRSEDEALASRSFLDVLHRVGVREGVDISLDTILAVVTALQVVNAPLVVGEAEMRAVEWGWDAADDVVRMRFVNEVDVTRAPALLDFLWSQVVPPRFSPDTFRVRKVVCRRLAMLGSAALDGLGREWATLVAEGDRGDLSAAARREPHWRAYGTSLASLGWVLPGVVAVADEAHRAEAHRLFTALRDVVAADDEGARRPEVGLEISLAEGFKAAAVELALRGRTPDPAWDAECRALFRRAHSWASRQVLLQALALVAMPGERHQAAKLLVEQCAIDSDEHPFVRETAALALRALRHREGAGTLVERHIWFDDIEALDDGGVNLAPEAHRLLGLSTLLINLVEHRFERWLQEGDAGDPHAVACRNLAFTANRLPVCFVRAGHAATMFDEPCTCDFGLCGPTANGAGGHRKFSRSFVQRAQGTARARSAIGRHVRVLARRSFEQSWRKIDKQLAATAAEQNAPDRRGSGGSSAR